mgnify:CR=1 FL=1
MILQHLDNVSLLDIKGKEIKRGVVISSVSLVKGLEFDKVIVYEANQKTYNEEKSLTKVVKDIGRTIKVILVIMK